MTIISTVTPSQSEPGSNGNELFHITQSTRTVASPSNGLVLYPGHLLGRSYSSVEIQPAYSTSQLIWKI